MNNSPAANSSIAEVATTLLHTTRSGVLSTISASHEGWPFGSVTPFALARDGAVVLALSDLAEHTRNVRADPRASLFVQDATARDDPQAGARATLLGRVAEAASDVHDDVRARYLARFPDAGAYLAKLDFRMYTLRCERVRLIAGFGRMGWIDANALGPSAIDDAAAQFGGDVVEHMNADHADVLRHACAAFRGSTATRVVMTGIDAWGFDARDEATGDRFRFDFDTRIRTADEARRALVALAHAARAKLGLER